MTDSSRRFVLAAFLALAGLGFVLPLWPLSALSFVLLSLWGRWFIAVLAGLLFDLAWGAPVGPAHFLYFPFALLAAATALVRLWASKYFIDRDLPERL